MKVVVQKVSQARCVVEGKVTGEIGTGYMLLVGFGHEDTRETAKKYARKIARLRIFEDENGKINRSIFDVGGSILSISQFTLYGDARKGNRPGFTAALGGPQAIELYDYFNECLREEGLKVETGIFGAMMSISLTNEGPITIILDNL
ncbi:MAG: D-tyrosyl-tRNA(Tyr) deacylase [Erysipelotrichaceae bacterium]|nr:D-tyrosyl-tRNA(Tyr) deacylase [Erysipelotrichaceae bacterium]